MVRRHVISIVAIVVLILGGLTAVIVTGTKPLLGLDLQGGISVTLNPVAGTRTSALDKAVQIIRNRVDGLGVAEPEISRQGSTVVVDLPGVKDRAKAEQVIGQTAELLFRPVLACLPAEQAAPPAAGGPAPTPAPAPGSEIPTTDPLTAKADQPIVTTGIKGAECNGPAQPRYQLGPAALKGEAVSSVQTGFQSGVGYAVNLHLDSKGSSDFNDLAAASYPKQPPQNRVAIVLDNKVQSAPAFQTPSFQGGNVQITGNFTQSSANDLSLVLRYGSLPVKFDAKKQQVESVSPTLGKDQLRAGIAAGLIGLALVALYMLLYYRFLGLVVWAGLALSGAALYALVCWLGQSIGLTLTLAGVTGIIVSVGITVDSYVVYFERLKDEVRNGRSIRSSVDRGFARAWKTIVAADLVSLIGAVALYALAVGSVRGFAFFLGLSTLLDLVIAYFFMHPVVALMSRRRGLLEARWMGMATALDVQEAAA